MFAACPLELRLRIRGSAPPLIQRQTPNIAVGTPGYFEATSFVQLLDKSEVTIHETRLENNERIGVLFDDALATSEVADTSISGSEDTGGATDMSRSIKGPVRDTINM